MTPPPEPDLPRRSVLAGGAGVVAGLLAGVSGCDGSAPVAGAAAVAPSGSASRSGPRRTAKPGASPAEHHAPTARPTTTGSSASGEPTHPAETTGPSGQPASPQPSTTETRPSREPTPSPSRTPTPSTSAEPPVVATADVPVGGGVVVRPRSVVVTQPEAGTFRGFDMHCTHQGCPVDSVADGTIRCPCHGSLFSVVDGSAVGGPATRALASRTLTVHDGGVYLA